jgi:hypothetical protein
MASLNRRDFVRRSLQVGALAGVGDLAFLHQLGPLSADDVNSGRSISSNRRKPRTNRKAAG